MKHTLLSLAIAAIAVVGMSGCAVSGRIMSSAGNLISKIDTPVTKGVGGFYTRTGDKLQGKPTPENPEVKKE